MGQVYAAPHRLYMERRGNEWGYPLSDGVYCPDAAGVPLFSGKFH